MIKAIKYSALIFIAILLTVIVYFFTLPDGVRQAQLVRTYVGFSTSFPNLSKWVFYPFLDRDYQKIIRCNIDEKTFEIPKGYFMFGGSVLGCHPGYKQIFMSAYLPNLLEVPGGRIRELGLKGRQLYQVSIVVNVDSKQNGLKEEFESGLKERARDFKLVKKDLWEDTGSKEEKFYTLKNKKTFYYLEPDTKTVQRIVCADYLNRQGGECSGKLRLNGFYIDFRFEALFFLKEGVSFIPEQIHSLIFNFSKKTLGGKYDTL